MNVFFVWLETTSFSMWVRDSPSVFAFPAILTLHTIGMGLVAGLSAAVDVRILGVAAGVPLTDARRFRAFLWFGFWLNAVSGVVLLIGYPTKALTNPLFYVKLALIAIGVAVQLAIEHRVLRNPNIGVEGMPRTGKILAAVSLVCWAAAIAAGRFLAYTYSVLTSV
ncbi:MAG: hypothetical protein WBD07_08965 [Vicinamibacterales bacterium]